MNRQIGLRKNRSVQHGRLSRSRRSGQAMIEMAACIFLLLAIVMGVMEYGFLITKTYAIGNATREGARFAALGNSTNAVKVKVASTGNTKFINASEITIQSCTTTTTTTTTNGTSTTKTESTPWVTVPDSNTNPNIVPVGDQIRVSVKVVHQPLTGMVPVPRSITQYTVMRRER